MSGVAGFYELWVITAVKKKLSAVQWEINQGPILSISWSLPKLWDDGEHWCLPYSSMVSTEMCGFRFHWYLWSTSGDKYFIL